MAGSPNSAEQLAREIAREAAFLPERQRAWLLAELRKDFEAFDQEEYRIDQLNRKMSEAVEALKRVAEHLQLKDAKARLALTIKEFDATPNKVRQDWTGRQVAEAMRRSWQLAKTVAFTNVQLPVAAERHSALRKQLARKRRETAFVLSGIQDWLATKPREKKQKDYEQWRRDHNHHQRAGVKPLPGKDAIRRRWQLPWPEIVKAVERNEVPGNNELEESSEAEPASNEEQSESIAAAKNYVLDSQFRAHRIRSAREARGWTVSKLAQQAGIETSNLAKIESDKNSNPSFETMAKIAIALNLSLTDFLKPA